MVILTVRGYLWRISLLGIFCTFFICMCVTRTWCSAARRHGSGYRSSWRRSDIRRIRTVREPSRRSTVSPYTQRSPASHASARSNCRQTDFRPKYHLQTKFKAIFTENLANSWYEQWCLVAHCMKPVWWWMNTELCFICTRTFCRLYKVKGQSSHAGVH